MSPRHEQSGWVTKQSQNVAERTELAVSEETASSVTVEAWLQRRGIKYAPATGIPISAIDTKRSRANQARKDPIVPESVERFATAMRNGTVFPPIVVHAVGTRLVIIDGNNRHEAALKAKREYIHGIIIDEDTSSELIQLLTVEANNSHGVTPPTEWRLQQAFHLQALGYDDDTAAEASGVTAIQLRNARVAAEATRRARLAGVTGFENVSGTAKQYLNAIRLEKVFAAAAHLVARHNFTVEETRQLCQALRESKSEEQQLMIVKDQAELRSAERKLNSQSKKRVNSPKSVLAMGVGFLAKCDPSELVKNIKTVKDRDEVRQRLADMEEMVLRFQAEMESLDDMGEE